MTPNTPTEPTQVTPTGARGLVCLLAWAMFAATCWFVVISWRISKAVPQDQDFQSSASHFKWITTSSTVMAVAAGVIAIWATRSYLRDRKQ